MTELDLIPAMTKSKNIVFIGNWDGESKNNICDKIANCTFDTKLDCSVEMNEFHSKEFVRKSKKIGITSIYEQITGSPLVCHFVDYSKNTNLKDIKSKSWDFNSFEQRLIFEWVSKLKIEDSETVYVLSPSPKFNKYLKALMPNKLIPVETIKNMHLHHADNVLIALVQCKGVVKWIDELVYLKNVFSVARKRIVFFE